MNRPEREFLDSLIAKRYSAHTIDSYQRDIDFFFEFLNEQNVLMANVDRNVIRDFEDSQLKKELVQDLCKEELLRAGSFTLSCKRKDIRSQILLEALERLKNQLDILRLSPQSKSLLF